jgi:hypothetical protein
VIKIAIALNQPISEIMLLPKDVFDEVLNSRDLLREVEARGFRANVHAIAATFGKNTKVFDIYKKIKSVISGKTLFELSKKYE